MRPGADDEEKRTNEIGTVIPLLDMLPHIRGRIFTTGTMLTQRKLATCLLDRGAGHAFPVKGNRKTLLSDISLTLDEAMAGRAPDDIEPDCKPNHGRKEKRSIRVSGELNDSVDFPGTGQVFAVHRETLEIKSGKQSSETAYCITSLSADMATPEQLLALDRGHWRIEANHHILDMTFDEDRSRIRTGHGPANATLLRRFAIGLIRQSSENVAETTRSLARKPRRVLDMLKLTGNTRPRTAFS